VSQLEEFYDWLEEQDYWVEKPRVEEEFPDIEFRESTGITVKKNEEGDILIPRRDLRALAKPVEDGGEGSE
jgi:hypothetical protein